MHGLKAINSVLGKKINRQGTEQVTIFISMEHLKLKIKIFSEH